MEPDQDISSDRWQLPAETPRFSERFQNRSVGSALFGNRRSRMWDRRGYGVVVSRVGRIEVQRIGFNRSEVKEVLCGVGWVHLRGGSIGRGCRGYIPRLGLCISQVVVIRTAWLDRDGAVIRKDRFRVLSAQAKVFAEAVPEPPYIICIPCSNSLARSSSDHLFAAFRIADAASLPTVLSG